MLKDYLPQLSEEVKEDVRQTRPFFYLLTFVLLMVYALAVFNNPLLRTPLRFAGAGLLMLLHISLHWVVHYLMQRSSWLAAYFIIQGVLVILLTLLSQSQDLATALVLALSGETVGLMQGWRRALPIIAAYLGLLLALYEFYWGWDAFPIWLGVTLIMIPFVIIYVVLYLRQANARAEAQNLLKELETAHDQLSTYAQQVESLTLETERQRMARELHDTLAQGLAGLVLQMEGLEAHLEQGNVTESLAITQQAKLRARTALADARRAIDNLRSRTADSPLPAIRREISRFTTTTGIPCTAVLPQTLTLPPETGEHLIRFVSEGLINVTRHARANRVWLTIAERNGRLHVQLRDDGVGFDMRNGAAPTGHYGLIGLRERARLAGGAFTIDSEPGEGTTLEMTLPLTSTNKVN